MEHSVLTDFNFGIPVRVIDPNEELKTQLLAETRSIVDSERNNTINPWSGYIKSTFRFDEEVNVIEDKCPLLKKFVYKSVHQFLSDLEVNPPYRMVIMDESWINFSEKGMYQEFHLHPESDISGVFYVDVPDNSGSIQFSTPSSAHSYHHLTHRSKFLRPNIMYPSVEGRIILFPSYLEHMVMINQSDSERISIAFNIKLVN